MRQEIINTKVQVRLVALREPHKGVILQSAMGAPKGVLREGVAPALWVVVAAVRAG